MRRFAAVAAGAVALSGCSAQVEGPVDDAGASSTVEAPAVVDVVCGSDLSLTVSSPEVAATAAGVAVRITSEAPAGAYLHYGIGGDEMPSEPEVWTLALPPGDVHLSCSTLSSEGPDVTVTVVDPSHHWSPLTLADLGCEVSGVPSWAIESGTGASAQEAVDALVAHVNDAGASPVVTRSQRAQIGYPEATSQTWILGTEQATAMTAVVVESSGTYSAWPDALCAGGEWVEAG